MRRRRVWCKGHERRQTNGGRCGGGGQIGRVGALCDGRAARVVAQLAVEAHAGAGVIGLRRHLLHLALQVLHLVQDVHVALGVLLDDVLEVVGLERLLELVLRREVLEQQDGANEYEMLGRQLQQNRRALAVATAAAVRHIRRRVGGTRRAAKSERATPLLLEVEVDVLGGGVEEIGARGGDRRRC